MRRWTEAIALCSTAFVLATVPPTPAGAQATDSTDVSRELQQLYDADQADRRFTSPPSPEEWAAVAARDSARRDRVLELVRAGALATADDHYHAAMVLQHGEGSEDILLAHILATVAGFEGHAQGKWLSAASLDRYLHRTRQPQRFGTQYVRVTLDEPFRLDPEAPWSQGPFVRWLPDAVRAAYGVRPLAEQAAWVEAQNGTDPGGTDDPGAGRP